MRPDLAFPEIRISIDSGGGSHARLKVLVGGPEPEGVSARSLSDLPGGKEFWTYFAARTEEFGRCPDELDVFDWYAWYRAHPV